uniref:Uncharacterized protein n=1 Tax=Sphaerodactylus townsendi TaxID=933632 RepID=A0ACB8FC42_9SAUR
MFKIKFTEDLVIYLFFGRLAFLLWKAPGHFTSRLSRWGGGIGPKVKLAFLKQDDYRIMAWFPIENVRRLNIHFLASFLLLQLTVPPEMLLLEARGHQEK